jgi:hypothetical protein
MLPLSSSLSGNAPQLRPTCSSITQHVNAGTFEPSGTCGRCNTKRRTGVSVIRREKQIHTHKTHSAPLIGRATYNKGRVTSDSLSLVFLRNIMLPHPVPSAEGTPFGGSLWKDFMDDLEKNAAGDKPVRTQ